MAKTIVQKVVFKNTSAGELYKLYMSTKLHALVTGAPANISKKTGGSFSAYGTYITGKNILLIANELILQTWKAEDWGEDTPYSIFMICLKPKGKNTTLHVVHANLPDKAAAGISKGWHEFYWKPWKQHLAGKKIKTAAM